MAKKTKDTATANEIAMSAELKSEKLPIADHAGVTDRLFPDFKAEETKQENKELPSSKSPDERSVQEVTSSTDEKSPPPVVSETDYLDIDKMSGKKLKLKADGVEFDGTLAEFAKRVQSQESIDKRFQRLAEERKAAYKERQEIQDLKKQIEELKTSFKENPSRTEPPEYHDSSYTSDPVIKEILNRNKTLEQQIQELQVNIQPALSQIARKSVAEDLKKEGFEDAGSFDKKIDAYLGSIDDEMLFQVEVKKANTPEGAKDIYRKIVLQEMLQNKKEQESRKRLKADPEVKEPPIVDIDSGSSTSSGAEIDDWKAKYKELRKRAMDGDEEAIQEAIAMKLK